MFRSQVDIICNHTTCTLANTHWTLRMSFINWKQQMNSFNSSFYWNLKSLLCSHSTIQRSYRVGSIVHIFFGIDDVKYFDERKEEPIKIHKLIHVSALFVPCNPFVHCSLICFDIFDSICLDPKWERTSNILLYWMRSSHPHRKSMDFFHFSVLSISVFCSVFTLFSWSCFFLLNNDNRQYKYIQHIAYIPTNPICFLLVLLFYAYINNRRHCVCTQTLSCLIIFIGLPFSHLSNSVSIYIYSQKANHIHIAIYEIHSSHHHLQKIQSFV